MRYVIACLLTLSFLPAQQPKPSIEGTWEGTIEAGPTKLKVGVTIARGADGALSAKMDVPQQGAIGLPLDDVTFEAGVLKFALKMANGSYSGKLNDAGTEISGTWVQGLPVPLVLKRVEKMESPKRSQDPVPPYPYKSEDLTFTNPTAQIKLAGTLTLPEGKGPFPAVVLITGSGPHNRDEELMGHRPFLVLSDYLTRRGIAVLRYDKRGVGKSEGKLAECTSEDFASDAQAGWQYLRERKEIDPQRVGLLGHSEGGIIAPMAAAKNAGIAFIVMLAGDGVTGEQIIYKQTVLGLKAAGVPEATINQFTELQKKAFDILREEKDPQRMIERISALPHPNGKDAAAAMAKAFASPWYRFFAFYDPAPALEKVKCPVLALNGELDTQVAFDQNLPAIEAALKKGGNKDYTVKALPKLNHLFQTCQTGAVAEYSQIDETMSPVALATIASWIRKTTHLDK